MLPLRPPRSNESDRNLAKPLVHITYLEDLLESIMFAIL